MVDRETRYKATDLFSKSAKRFDTVDILSPEDVEKLPGDIYEHEKKCTPGNDSSAGTIKKCRDEYSAYIVGKYPHVKRALELLGDPLKVTQKVHTPRIINGSAEIKTFEWFVHNDNAQSPQHLIPITDKDSDSDLPTLKMN